MISEISVTERIRWDDIVKSFKNPDVNYFNAYAEAFHQCGEGDPKLIYIEEGGTRAMNVVMERDIALAEPFQGRLEPGEWIDIATPYGYGGFWVEGADAPSIEREYEKYCREKGYISEFVRFHLYSGYETVFTGTVEEPTTNVVRSLDEDMEEIFQEFEHKVRSNIRKARQQGVTVEFDPEGKRLGEFLRIYYATMERKQASCMYYFAKDCFLNINKMTGSYTYVHALYQGRVISTELMIYGRENCYSFLGGCDCEYFSLRPNELLKYEAFRWAKEQGLKRVILGGGCGQDDSLFRYKRSFAPAGLCRFHIGKRIFDEKRYQYLVGLRRKDELFDPATAFFPAYRAQSAQSLEQAQ